MQAHVAWVDFSASYPGTARVAIWSIVQSYPASCTNHMDMGTKNYFQYHVHSRISYVSSSLASAAPSKPMLYMHEV